MQFSELREFVEFIAKSDNLPQNVSDKNDAGISKIQEIQNQYCRRHNLFVNQEFLRYRLDPIKRNVYIWDCIEKDQFMLTSLLFLSKHTEEIELSNVKSALLSARGANAGYVNRVFTNFWSGNSCYSIDVNASSVDWNYVYFCLKNGEKKLLGEQQKGGIPAISKKQVEQFRIPTPPLPVQQEIVRILDSFTELTAELTARRKQYEYYRDELLTFGDDVPRIPLSEVGPVCMCKRILKSQTNDVGGILFYKMGTFGKAANAYISENTYEEYRSKYNFPKKGDILISAAGTIGRTVVYDGEPAYFQDSNIVWIANDESKILNRFLIHCYAMKPWYVSTGGTSKCR